MYMWWDFGAFTISSDYYCYDSVNDVDFKFQFIIVHFIRMKSLFRIFTKFSVCNGCTLRIDDLLTTNYSSYFSSLSCCFILDLFGFTIHVHTDAALISLTICFVVRWLFFILLIFIYISMIFSLFVVYIRLWNAFPIWKLHSMLIWWYFYYFQFEQTQS